MEFFVQTDESSQRYEYWKAERLAWYLGLGMPAEQLRLREHDADELSHYSSGTSDVEYLFPWGWDELEGIANRGDYDLTQHAKASGERLEYFDQAANERYTPHVIEPAAGATRTAMAFLMAAYDEEEVEREGQGKGETRVVLRFHPRIAPYKVAVLPLSKKPELAEPAREVLSLLQPQWMCDYDETQAIGRRYRRQDELGTPLCVTVDFDTLEDRAVTVRDRDTMAQERVPIAELVDRLRTDLDA
jgi:glycyl-tRNA synthetase